MSYSPATPNKTGNATNSSTNVTKSSTDKLTATSKVKQASLNEPSPASTYGDTVGSSAPATPQDAASHDPVLDLAHSLRAAQIDPAIQAISGSPMTGQQAKLAYVPYGRPEDLLRFQSQASLSPTKKEMLTDMFRNPSTQSSPGSDRLKHIQGSPSWRQSAMPGDDVFVSGVQVHVGNSHQQGTSYSPRNDRLGITLSRDTAQALLPADSCVFVANLMSTLTEDQLEHHVHNVFVQFGECFTKIKRDNKGMPFAFVQYHNAVDAKRAITEGRGLLVAGRPCRTEAAKVHRSVYLSKVTGDPVSVAEARTIMSQHGTLESVWHSSKTEKEMYSLPEGIWVKYAFFDDCRDAQVRLRDDPMFRLEQPATPESGRFRAGGHSYQAGSPMQRSSPSQIMHSPGRRAVADRRSIFVGNLPPTANEEELNQMFNVYGQIVNIEIIRKVSGNLHGVNIFAFIEYGNPGMAIHAVQAAQGVAYHAYLLRVELKESSDPGYSTNRRDLRFGAGGSPRSQFMGGSPTAMSHMFFQQGLLAGLAQAQTQALPPPSPMYPALYYHQTSDPSVFGQFHAPAAPNTNNTAAVHQTYGNGYMAQPMVQSQHSQIPAEYVHAQQQPSYQPYQWPLSNAGSANTKADD